MHRHTSFLSAVLTGLTISFGLLTQCRKAEHGVIISDSDSDSTNLAADTTLALQKASNDLTSAAWNYADSVLALLTIEEKAGMMLMPATYARNEPSEIRRILYYADSIHAGGLVLLKGNLDVAAFIADTLLNSSRRKGKPAPFIAVDAENGLRMRFPDAPEFPWSNELGKLKDDQIMYEFGRELARECRLTGINMVLGPVMDVLPDDGPGGLLRKRSLGSNPQKVADLALAYARGIEDGNVISVAKHFPGHGSSGIDTHKGMGKINRSFTTMDSVDLYPFRCYSKEGLSGIMTGHLAVRSLDTILRPAVVSPVIMGDLLRGRLGFRGLILTDAINMKGAEGVRAWESIAAGADLVIAPADTKAELQGIIKAFKSGDLSEKTVNDRCRRILFYKYLVLTPSREVSGGKNLQESVAEMASEVLDSLRSNLRKFR